MIFFTFYICILRHTYTCDIWRVRCSHAVPNSRRWSLCVGEGVSGAFSQSRLGCCWKSTGRIHRIVYCCRLLAVYVSESVLLILSAKGVCVCSVNRVRWTAERHQGQTLFTVTYIELRSFHHPDWYPAGGGSLLYMLALRKPIATMQSMVTGQAPITPECKFSSGGNFLQKTLHMNHLVRK